MTTETKTQAFLFFGSLLESVGTPLRRGCLTGNNDTIRRFCFGVMILLLHTANNNVSSSAVR